MLPRYRKLHKSLKLIILAWSCKVSNDCYKIYSPSNLKLRISKESCRRRFVNFDPGPSLVIRLSTLNIIPLTCHFIVMQKRFSIGFLKWSLTLILILTSTGSITARQRTWSKMDFTTSWTGSTIGHGTRSDVSLEGPSTLAWWSPQARSTTSFPTWYCFF